jgi:hypothetical protein
MSIAKGRTVARFKGIDAFRSMAVVPPEYATDCLNVICSPAGHLAKLRYPTELTDTGIGAGPDSFSDYQRADGVRQVVIASGISLYYFNLSDFIVNLIAANALYQGPWDMVESNNILYMTNGVVCKKWDGTNLYNWGIDAPTVAPAYLPISPAIDTIPNNGAVRAAGIVTITYAGGVNPFEIGDVILNAGISVGATDFNGTFTVTARTATTVSYPQAGANEVQGGGTSTGVGNLTVVTSEKYVYTYKNSVIGGESNPSPISLSTGALTNAFIRIAATPSPDPQVDTICWYKTLDGGGDFFLFDEIPIGLGYQLKDDELPTDVNQQFRAPLYNDPPIPGKYLQVFQGRIFIGNIIGGKHDIIYSGYEQIYRGRPEECFPPYNRLRLSIGADDIRGIGVIQAGVVAFSKSNEMYMFRGLVEDITTSAPVQFSAYLEQLPWSIGAASHWSIQATMYGVIWVGSDLCIYVFNGTARPIHISFNVNPVMRTVTAGQEHNIRSAYYGYADRDWYAACLPTGGSIALNKVVVIDLTPDEEENGGIWLCDTNAQSIGVIEDADGSAILAVGIDGVFSEFQALADEWNGITRTFDATDNILTAFYRTGYFGGDTPDIVKMFRWAELVADQIGFRVICWLVEGNDIAHPVPSDLQDVIDGYIETGLKGKRLAIEIQFPLQDVAANVLSLTNYSIPLGPRPGGDGRVR